MKITDKRTTPILSRTQAETDVIFVEMVARLGDVQAIAEQVEALYETGAA